MAADRRFNAYFIYCDATIVLSALFLHENQLGPDALS